MKAKVNFAGKFCLFVLVIYQTQATENNTLYKLAERKSGCVEVDSLESCPISWKLSATAAKFYEQQTRQVSRALTGLNSSDASDECKTAFKTTMCGQGAPKCLTDGSQDYGDADATCAKIYSKCPRQDSDFFKSQKLCDNIISGKIEKPKCVKPSNIEGNCPQPKYKVCGKASSPTVFKCNTASLLQAIPEAIPVCHRHPFFTFNFFWQDMAVKFSLLFINFSDAN